MDEQTNLHRYEDEAEQAAAAADFIVARAQQAIQERGQFNLALTGAFSALDTYRQLAERPELDWLNVYLFWADERCVPADDPANHYRMVQTNLLAHIDIPHDNVHPVICEEDAKVAAESYENMLRAHFGPQQAPRFDLIVLGLGAEGQIAATQPQSMALEQRDRWVVADFSQELGEWRMTLTPYTINQARCVQFLVRGKEKSEALRRSLEPDGRDADWPASYIQPQDGEVHWFVDEPAAVLL